MRTREGRWSGLVAISGDGGSPAGKVTDEELMLQYQNGNVDAFTELVHRYKNRLINTAYRMVNDYAKAEDIAQETFLRVHRNAARYRSIARFSTWIYTIAINVARNEIRNTKRKRLVSLDAFGMGSESGETTYDIPDESALPDAETENRELRRIFNDAIEKLPERYRAVFVLRDVDGLTYEEIAEIVKVPKGTVKSRMNRARQKFKELIEPILGERDE